MFLKVCTKCGIDKPLSEFWKDKSRKDSLCSKCIVCKNKEFKIFHKKYKYISILYDIRQRCNNPKNHAYKYYGKKGIKCLLSKEDIKFLWYRDKAWMMDKPSINRKNSNKNYIINNCEFIERSLNSKLANIQQSKPIIQYDKNGKYMREFSSITDASNQLNLWRQNISKCINGHSKSTGGFIFKMKGK